MYQTYSTSAPEAEDPEREKPSNPSPARPQPNTRKPESNNPKNTQTLTNCKDKTQTIQGDSVDM